MPIRFRCGYCNRLLGIARRKAGTETTCPHCGYTLTVPEPPDDRTELAEFQAVVKPAAAESAPQPPAQEPEKPPARVPPPLPKRAAEEPAAPQPDDRPLFEKELDAVLGGLSAPSAPADEKKRKPPTSGMDALSLDPGPRQVVLSPQQVTALAVGALVLVILAFVAGFLVGSIK